MNVREIVTSWFNSFNGTKEQKELALERLEICNGCEHMKTNSVNIIVCGNCGCPINAKIFSPIYNSCPLKKWEDSDKNYKQILKDKI